MAHVHLRAVALVLALMASACGRPDAGFDTRTLETAIPAAIVPDDPTVVTDVTCPDLPTSVATTITCSALVSGRPIEITAVISIDGEVNVSTDSVLLDLAGVADEAARRLSSDLGVESTVECPGRVVVSVAGDTFRCSATDPGGVTHDLLITIIDDRGTWSIDLAD